MGRTGRARLDPHPHDGIVRDRSGRARFAGYGDGEQPGVEAIAGRAATAELARGRQVQALTFRYG